ncbi:Asp-tRNA(Asn)/Glu-tRNA(Gln) amidotransferase GatCAB subunit C [Candidatus Collierbacteria bacterium CG17_big_fil_post_rev_8_21_14_2_50_45_7]|uniref:Aspartyl/glutamyl-tRNA(Asn/Gln) amidotransferase subunit C n=2 Tax=Candidatus Collieribacteriota TaxID=1752725 RepID=A0A2H0WYE4_9BACT|nr:MAG: Asp-tRNA(Asn)/Glu-tRNA(Gln) amidotransferase GatCAB subunit C [Candidatus Collierbacteria bacterium CG09_land_8_20_14_0_10_46_12]PIW06694.1 MAG: Asp-tRNA(Asn)/Glu-tRNA(Gln) amidotransferase GatCAB subunit C [Candidatus Collierbacteria bacterium CG17_big_fil_post_rev_8_21_14_2_50_45_7]
MTKTKLITTADIKHLAKLANLPLSPERLTQLASQIETTFEYIQTTQNTDTSKYLETNQVNELSNILREDIVDDSHTFTQEQALQNAKQTHNGYFIVPAILE